MLGKLPVGIRHSQDREACVTVKIHVEIAAKINFAFHQSTFPLLRDLRVENLSEDEHLDGLVVKFRADIPFIKDMEWNVDRVAARGEVSIQNRDLQLDGNFFLNLADSVRGTVTVQVEKDGSVLGNVDKPIELLAYNEWGGTEFMPELLAAFSTPNDPAIDRILRSASEVLRKAGKNDGLDGYHSSRRERVWEMVSAVYAAIANLRLSYSQPPASFERNGQKIRLPSQILEGRVGTCLDTTMLFASVLEQAGLNLIIAIPQGHALVGVWLQPESLATVVSDEAETLRKRVDLNELVLIETTCVTSHPLLPFSKAVAAAKETITPEKDSTFVAAVDIRRARAHRIMPLGLRRDSSKTDSMELGQVVEIGLEEAPSLPDFDIACSGDEKLETSQSRIRRWQDRLLDLTPRNRLLNYREKIGLTIICPDPDKLEDKLADGKTQISIKPLPRLSAERWQDKAIHRRRSGEEITDEYARDALDKKQVLVDLSNEELSRRISGLYRKAQESLQESGANTLYLALGFLRWKRTGSRDFYYAPLILFPVTLERRSIRSDVKMMAHDDGPRFNDTLLEMLRMDFGIDIKGVGDVLPPDQSGIDVKKIWKIVQDAVSDSSGLEVMKKVFLGHFSFAKYLMWKDLGERREALKENTVIRYLLGLPGLMPDPCTGEADFDNSERIDRTCESDMLTPLTADSSQLEAIAMADQSRDFIIIGPPGTGKSQTISNLIAHLLGKGKTVLFVSEKTAALNVVYRRLEEIGLGHCCLELHSNKTSRTHVAEQLARACESGQAQTEETWKREAARLRDLRDKLNRVVGHLHREHRNGLTAHYAIGIKVRDEVFARRVKFSWSSAGQHDKADLQAMCEAVRYLAIYAKEVGDISSTPFHRIVQGRWSPQWEEQISDLARDLSTCAKEADRACMALCEAIEIALPDRAMNRLDDLVEFAALLEDPYRNQTAYALDPDGQDRIEALEKVSILLKSYAADQASLSCAYDPFAWRTLDGGEIERHWQAAETAWWPKRVFARRKVIKAMGEGGARGKPDPAKDAPLLRRLREKGEQIDRLDDQLAVFKDWAGHATDSATTELLCRLGNRMRVAVGKLADDTQSLIKTRDKIRTLLHDGNDLLAPNAAVGRVAKAFRDSLERFQQSCAAFEEVSGQPVREVFEATDQVLEQIHKMAETISQRRSELRRWCDWSQRRADAINLGLRSLVEAVEHGCIPVEEIPVTFEAAYCSWWSEAIIGEDEVLRTFSTLEHTQAIRDFRHFDECFQKTTAAYIAAKLAGARSDHNQHTQWGQFHHELRKKRHSPIRQIMQKFPDVVRVLTPCMMMSPLSVVQYLPSDHALFDFVIFDEASQITVWDAVGAITRGRQVIVAGDPKQMPPSNFFARSEDDPDGDVDVEGDLESILDAMLSTGIPQSRLNLHYRSRKESLIAFSNDRYYDNSLITFPAPKVRERGVHLVRPEGVYERGQSRCNQGEARAIVEEIVRRLSDPDPEIRKRSIGVVTFNSEQQTLIENLLDKARRDNPKIEWAFLSEQVTEPVFVKNIETVQGDERDVILFSITYGPDRSDHVTMNFGPLNREGGERRLNVALTRARFEMCVFSTLHPDRLDLSRTSARAVKDLKHFLEYAEKGPSVLGTTVFGPGGDFESPFEVAVARGLRDKGWEIHPQIGVSAYRIDLGVVHPNKPGVYLAGVECDGAMYHSAASARERDRIRQDVLNGLGWKLFRVWSSDWWTDRLRSLNSLDENLRQYLEQDRAH